MGSVKCTLRKEVKNEIAKYIDSEFINEAIKEITTYIKTTHKVQIDDLDFDENNINSKVILKDDGPFNVYDYTYVKDFIYEVSWEGSYVKELEEDESTNEYKEVYKYLPKDIATVIYEKVEKIMEQRKGQLYKEFNAYKSASSRLIKKEYPVIRNQLWKEYFWSRSYCLLTTGGAPIEVVRKYIESQGMK